MHLYLRNEHKKFEHRVILTPDNCRDLILSNTAKITVESSSTRCFTDAEYEQVGCHVTKKLYEEFDRSTYILGLKELYHTTEKSFLFCHVFFAHCYKEQTGWKELLHQFKKGRILDLEFLIENNRRVAAFGFYAGYAGAALSIDVYNGNAGPYAPQAKSELLERINSGITKMPNVMVLGALGRCGKGAIQCCLDLGIPKENILQWDLQETKKGGPFEEILQVDVFINCIYLSNKIEPFLTKTMLKKDKTIKVICDVSCDYTSANNPIPVYHQGTTFEKPIVVVDGNVKVIAIDHLPTLLPREASTEFGNQLLPYVKQLPENPFGDMEGVWKGAVELFEQKKTLALNE